MGKRRIVRRPHPLPFGLVTAAALGLGACQALPPAVGTALVGFGQDVLAAAAQNFAPQYATSMNSLFLAMAETATGMPFTQQAENGDAAAVDGEGAYAQETWEDGDYAEAAYEEGYGPEQYDPAQSGQAPYGAGEYDQEQYAQEQHAQEQYGQGQYGQAPQGQYDQGQYQQGPYPQGQNEQPQYGQGAYGPVASGNAAGAAAPAPYGAPAGIALEVALLAQQLMPDAQVRLRPVQDGEVLYDGRGDPAAGDKIKIFFAANCACHVYVIGIDATGYVARIFPDGNTHTTSRVAAGTKYLVPGGTAWWGLDPYRGIEQIYFIVSHERRPDIENLVAQLAGRRPNVPANYRPVREPAIVAMNRGLVQVQSAAPAVVPTEYGAGQQISPTLFQSTVANADLVLTRWFRHE